MENEPKPPESEPTMTPSAGQDPDPFDPVNLRVTGDGAAMGARRLIVSVPVRKPGKQEFVRVHPSSDYAVDVALLELREER